MAAALLPMGLLASATTAAPPPRRTVVGIHDCGWAENWHRPGGFRHYRWPMITELCASSYTTLYPNGSVHFGVCGKAGDWKHAEYSAMRALAKQHGVRWTFNLGVAGMTTPKLAAFLNDSAVRARAVSGLVGVLQQESADGFMLGAPPHPTATLSLLTARAARRLRGDV